MNKTFYTNPLISIESGLGAPLRPLPDPVAPGVVNFWRQFLGVRQMVYIERISPFQVTGPNGRPGCSLVGVVYDEARATIYHTRALTPEDIVHELLHVRFPHYSEERVVAETHALVNTCGPHRCSA